MTDQQTPVSAAIPVDRWVCVEWYIVPSATASGHATLWFDGQLISDYAGPVVAANMPLRFFGLGITANLGTLPMHVFYDRLAFGRQRIGCGA